MILFNEQAGRSITRSEGLVGEVGSQTWPAQSRCCQDAWQWTPFALYRAGGRAIGAGQRAARLDTSSPWTMFWPRRLIAPALGTVTMLRLVETFKILDIPYTLTGGGPGVSTQTYSYYIYQEGLRNFDMGYASALAYMLVFVAIFVTSIFFWRVRERYEVQ